MQTLKEDRTSKDKPQHTWTCHINIVLKKIKFMSVWYHTYLREHSTGNLYGTLTKKEEEISQAKINKNLLLI
jgi:hypothetical protein